MALAKGRRPKCLSLPSFPLPSSGIWFQLKQSTQAYFFIFKNGDDTSCPFHLKRVLGGRKEATDVKGFENSKVLSLRLVYILELQAEVRMRGQRLGEAR